MSRKVFGSRVQGPPQLGLGVVAALAIALVGCGGSEDKVTSQPESLRVPAEPQAAVASATLPVSAEEGETIASADSLPPEIDVEVASTQVQPGEAVEITALGSPDVRDVILTDGLGKSTSFTYDLQAKAWRAFYRIPMKHMEDRLGLSVTAKNDDNRWRRVWLFLKVQDSSLSTTSGAASIDSTKH